jgi:hypothetical protein
LRTLTETLTGRFWSSQVYQVALIPASCATYSRRSPGVRRRGPGGNPTSAGNCRSRRVRRKLLSSCRRMSSGVDGRLDGIGFQGIIYTSIKYNSGTRFSFPAQSKPDDQPCRRTERGASCRAARARRPHQLRR